MHCETQGTKSYEEVPVIQPAVIYDEEEETITLFVLQRDTQKSVDIELDFRSFGKLSMIEHVILDGPDIYASNSFEEPEKVKPRKLSVDSTAQSLFTIELPRLSWNMLRFKKINV
jgi:alpha-N-arabinofuranosidase